MGVEVSNLATSFRPKTFGEVMGQELAVDTLRRIAGSDGIVCRSIFLRGSYGSGKTTLARIFGKALNCVSFRKDGDVCNVCSGCEEVVRKGSTLYLELDSSVVGNKEGIQTLRNMLSVGVRGRRLVVLDEVHACSVAAMNMLLKIVEEGIPDTIFMFCSTEDILPTLRSRCVNIDITLIPDSVMFGRLRELSESLGISISDDDLGKLVVKAGGHVRDALSLLQYYSMVGSAALSSAYDKFRIFVYTCYSSSPSRDPEELLRELLQYSVLDIKRSIGLFIRSVYLSVEGSIDYRFRKSGAIRKVFDYFFSPVVQQALQDEYGVEIALRAFMDQSPCKRSL